MSPTIFYIAQCPICEQGLVRVRIHSERRNLSPFFVCDECDAAWSDVKLSSRLSLSSERSTESSKSVAESSTEVASPNPEKLDQLKEPLDRKLDAGSLKKQRNSKELSQVADIWGENTHWATAPEIALLGLYKDVKMVVGK